MTAGSNDQPTFHALADRVASALLTSSGARAPYESFVRSARDGLALDHSMAWLLEYLAREAGATRAFYQLFARDGQPGEIRAWPPASGASGSPALPQALEQRVRLASAPVVIEDWASETEASVRPGDPAAIVALPLRGPEGTVGLVVACCDRPTPYGPAKRQVFDGLSECAHLVLANALSFDDMIGRLKKFELINEVSLAITATVQLDRLLQLILHQLLSLCGGDQGYVLLGEGENLVCLASRDRTGRAIDELQISRSVVNRCLAENRSILILDTGADEASQTASVMALDLKSIMAVPLSTGNACIGVLYISSNAISKTFTDQDRMLLESIATQAALTIRNAQLVKEQERQIMLLEETLEKYRAAEVAASTDMLTGLFNRRAFEERVRQEYEQSRRNQRIFAVILLDVDHFKQVNDTYGHGVGDAVLALIGRLLPANVRPYDVTARFGGEEFVVLLPDTSAQAAMIVAERIRQAIANEPVIDAEGNRLRPVTASLGIAELGSEDAGLAAILERADRALYACKAAGRNQSCIWRPDLPTIEAHVGPEPDAHT